MGRLSGLVFAAALMVAVVVTGCKGPRDGVLRDADGNTYAIKTMPDGRSWMTANLNLDRRDSSCYQDSGSECRRFGRLYAWAAAREACRLLGATWRLPTDDDDGIVVESLSRSDVAGTSTMSAQAVLTFVRRRCHRRVSASAPEQRESGTVHMSMTHSIVRKGGAE